MKTNIWKHSFRKFWHSSFQTTFCCLLDKVFLWGVHRDLFGDLSSSNYISLEGIHRFSSSVETKAKPLFQSNIFLDPNFEVKIPLECMCWFSLAVCTMKCLFVLSLFTVKKIQRNHNNIHNPDSLCIFYLYMVYFSLLL